MYTHSVDPHLLILVGNYCHELCLWENVCAEPVSDLLLDGQVFVSFGIDDMYPRLVLVHGV